MYTHKIQSFEDDEGGLIKVKPQSAKALLVESTTNPAVKTDEEDNILSVNFLSHDFSLGDVFKFNCVPYKLLFKINKIREHTNAGGIHKFYLYTDITNNSSIFLLPMYAWSRNKMFWGTHLINAYAFNEFDDEYPRVHLLYKYLGTREFHRFEKELSENEYIDKIIEVDKQHTLYTMRVPERFVDDYEYFTQSKYSKFSNELKNRILKFHRYKKDGAVYDILHKTEKRRKMLSEKFDIDINSDAELWDAIEEDKETFREELIINNYEQKLQVSEKEFKGRGMA